MDKAYVKDGHLYLEYTFYDVSSLSSMGYKDKREIIPLSEITKMNSFVGPKGGDHGWELIGKEKWEHSDEPKELTSFGRKQGDLCMQVQEIMEENGIPFEEMPPKYQ